MAFAQTKMDLGFRVWGLGFRGFRFPIFTALVFIGPFGSLCVNMGSVGGLMMEKATQSSMESQRYSRFWLLSP